MKCPRCGSKALRRSMPRSGLERLIRAWTPYHFYLCRECEYRGTHFGPVPSASGEAGRHVPSRPVELRDKNAVHQRRQRVVLSILLASLLGIASGIYLQSCHHEAELNRMQSADVEQHRIE